MNRSWVIAAALPLFGMLPSYPQSKAGKTTKSAKSQGENADPYSRLLNQADEAMAKEDYPAAIAALEKFTAAKPDVAYGFFQLGYAHTGAKHWELARAAYEKAVALDPKMGAAHLNLGLILLERAEPREAIQPLQRASELLPERAQVKFLLGNAEERAGNGQQAIAAYRAAIQQDAKSPEYFLALGRTLLNLEQSEEAQKAFEGALNLRPDAAQARLGLAQSLLAQKKWRQATTELEQYLRAVPDDSSSRQQMAHALLQLGKAEEALRELDRADSSGAPSLESRKMRVDALLQLKRLEDAAQVLAAILAAEPQNPELHALLGRLQLQKRDFAAAEKSLVTALRQQPDHLDALRDLASTYYLAENYPAALQIQDLLAKKEEPTAFFWFVRGTCFDKLGMKPQALEAYEKFLAMDQGRSDKQDFQARERLKVIRRELEKKH